MKILYPILLLWLILHGTPAAAHSFNLVFVAPLSEPSGRSALDGFLLATTEQDGHPHETSDGHLGGLDSHIFEVDSSTGKTDTAARLEQAIETAAPLFATGWGLDRVPADMLESSGVVIVDPTDSRFRSDRVARGERLTTMNGGLFHGAFQQAYGYRPDIHAIQGYLAARVIADAVRKSSEADRANPVAIGKLVEAALNEPSW